MNGKKFLSLYFKCFVNAKRLFVRQFEWNYLKKQIITLRLVKENKILCELSK